MRTTLLLNHMLK